MKKLSPARFLVAPEVCSAETSSNEVNLRLPGGTDAMAGGVLV